MPRSNRPRRRHGERRWAEPDCSDRLFVSSRRIETRRGVEWNVQAISALQAQKNYLCPGCGREIPVGVEHVVAWRADGVLGDSADLAARRHWHSSCWKIT